MLFYQFSHVFWIVIIDLFSTIIDQIYLLSNEYWCEKQRSKIKMLVSLIELLNPFQAFHLSLNILKDRWNELHLDSACAVLSAALQV